MALLFDADPESVNHGSAASLDSLTAFTFFMWCYPLAITGGTYYQCMFKQTGSGSAGFSMYRIGDQYGLYAVRASNYDERISTGVVTTNEWQVLAGTFDTTNRTVLYRGTATSAPAQPSYAVEDLTGSGALQNADAEDFYVGINAGFSGDNFNGRISFVGFWNRTLTLAELERVWRETRLGGDALASDSGCVIWSPYGLVSTGTQPDYSGNGNNGTVTGATLGTHPPFRHPFLRPPIWNPYVVAAAPVTRTQRLALLGVN